MFRVGITALARKATSRASAAAASTARASAKGNKLTARDVNALKASIARRRAAIEKAIKTGNAPSARRRGGGIGSARKAATSRVVSRSTKSRSRAVGTNPSTSSGTTSKRKALQPSRAFQKTFPPVANTKSWVSVMSAALKKRIEEAARQQRQSQKAHAPAVAAATTVAAVVVPAAGRLAKYEVKDQQAVDTIIAEMSRGRAGSRPRPVPATTKSARAKASAKTGHDADGVITLPPSVDAVVVSPPFPAPVPVTTTALPTVPLLPAPNTFLSRDWVEMSCETVKERLTPFLTDRARAVAPDVPPSARPISLHKNSPVHLVHIDGTLADTPASLLDTEQLEKRLRAQLHAPIFDYSVSTEQINPISRWGFTAPASVESYKATTAPEGQIVVVVLTTCSPTEAAAVEAGWSAAYVQSREKPLFSVAQLREPASEGAVPSVQLTSALVARVVVLSASESRQYVAQAKARQSLGKKPAAARTRTRSQKASKATAASASVGEQVPATTSTSTSSDDIAQLVDDALKCALENTKTEIASFVRVSVREAFAECEAVRQDRHEMAWRRYQQRQIAMASRRRALSPAQRDEFAARAQADMAGTPAPVFLEASQQQIDEAVAKAVDMAIGKLHNDQKPE